MVVMHKQQSGFVSIVVAALIMIILSLLTIGFTRIMQREQRQALDRQLSRQALYAAESAVNDVYAALQANPALQPEKTDCAVPDLKVSPYNVLITAPTGNIEYTCVLYDKSPKVLELETGIQKSELLELKSKDNKNISKLTIKWGASNGAPITQACNSALPSSSSEPLIKMDLTLTRSGPAELSRANLQSRADNFYLRPCRDGGSPAAGTVATRAYSPLVKGDLVNVVCANSGAQPCTAEITFDATQTTPSLFARIKPVYADSRISITGQQYVAGNAGSVEDVEFALAQTSIDVTARSNDVLRRLRVAIPVSEPNYIPEAAVQVFNGICKRLTVIPLTYARDNCSYP
jgi:Tfp pilus assembly protein PilX